MDHATAATALNALHAHLHALLPDLLKLEELLRASLAHAHAADIAALLHQRQQQCVAAVALLRGLPAGAAGREVEGLQALLAARSFIESSAAMVQDVQVGRPLPGGHSGHRRADLLAAWQRARGSSRTC